MVKNLIEKALDKTKSLIKQIDPLERFPVRVLPATPLGQGIPTLKPGEYRPFTPQLRERYEIFGRWERATHGHWLGLEDMEALWREGGDDELLGRIKEARLAGEENWPNEVSALFRKERLSLFAGNDLVSNESIYLLWLDFEDEPEVWVYDSNGESRYKDLEEYLKAYLSDDISASERRWRL